MDASFRWLNLIEAGRRQPARRAAPPVITFEDRLRLAMAMAMMMTMLHSLAS